MGMFDNYDNLHEDYVPDNRHSNSDRTMEKIDTSKVHKVYNAKGNFVGVSWHRGETVDLEFPLCDRVFVDSDAIIYEGADECPTPLTIGHSGQKAYNVVDKKSWTCVGISNQHYIWTLDAELLVPADGTKEIIFPRDWTDKSVIFNIYNFRWEEVFAQTVEAADNVVLPIGAELSESLYEGSYYCVVKLQKEGSSEVITKLMLIVN